MNFARGVERRAQRLMHKLLFLLQRRNEVSFSGNAVSPDDFRAQ